AGRGAEEDEAARGAQEADDLGHRVAPCAVDAEVETAAGFLRQLAVAAGLLVIPAALRAQRLRLLDLFGAAAAHPDLRAMVDRPLDGKGGNAAAGAGDEGLLA